MAGRKRHSAEDIVRKLRRADELSAEGKTGEEIGEILGISRRAVERRLDRAKELTGTLNRHGIVGLCLRKGWIT